VARDSGLGAGRVLLVPATAAGRALFAVLAEGPAPILLAAIASLPTPGQRPTCPIPPDTKRLVPHLQWHYLTITGTGQPAWLRP
jgi:hypothetical protein